MIEAKAKRKTRMLYINIILTLIPITVEAI